MIIIKQYLAEKIAFHFGQEEVAIKIISGKFKRITNQRRRGSCS